MQLCEPRHRRPVRPRAVIATTGAVLSEGHELHEDSGQMSIQDDDDFGYEPGRRVLKVRAYNEAL